MTQKHTPGPWLFRLEAVRTVIYHEGEVGEKAIAVGAGHYPDHVANARLIAAAPKMLSAIDRYLAARKAFDDAPTHNEPAFDAAMAEHDAALAELSRVSTLARGNPA